MSHATKLRQTATDSESNDMAINGVLERCIAEAEEAAEQGQWSCVVPCWGLDAPKRCELMAKLEDLGFHCCTSEDGVDIDWEKKRTQAPKTGSRWHWDRNVNRAVFGEPKHSNVVG